MRTLDQNGNVTWLLDRDGNRVPLSRCAKAQLYGEFVHAFQDTFSHRRADNSPYPVTSWAGGLGHALGGHEPDYTYNDIIVYEQQDPSTVPTTWTVTGVDVWGYREQRTLQMQEELWEMFQRDFGPNGAGSGGVTPRDGMGNPITWQDLAGDGQAWVLTGNRDARSYPLDSQGRPRDSFGNVLERDTGRILIPRGDEPAGQPIQWQRTCDQSAGGVGCQAGGVLQSFNRARTLDEKLTVLNFWMADHGFESIPTYNVANAAMNRGVYLQDLVVQNDFEGVLLPTQNDASCIGGSYSVICP